MQEQQCAQESPLDVIVPADDAFRVPEGLEKVPEAIGSFERPLDGAVPPAVTAVGDFHGEVVVEGPADHHVGNMASSNPDDHEDAEDDVANGGKPKVFEALCKLHEY